LLLSGILVLQVLILVGMYTEPGRDQETGPAARGGEEAVAARGAEETSVPYGMESVTRGAPHGPQPPVSGVAMDPFLQSFLDTASEPPLHLLRAHRFKDQVDRMFEQAALDLERWGGLIDMDSGWDSLLVAPVLDMRQEGDSYVVIFSLPGIQADDVTVTLEGRLLTILAPVGGPPGRAGHRGVLERKIQLPGPVADAASAQATLSKGVLRVVIPRGRSGGTDSTRLRLL